MTANHVAKRDKPIPTPLFHTYSSYADKPVGWFGIERFVPLLRKG